MLLKILNLTFSHVEKLFFGKSDSKIEKPPIFVIGPPCSGSTLLYQLLIFRYGFGYLSNFSARLYQAPVFATHLAKLLFRRAVSKEYTSIDGKTSGLQGPHEGGEFWYRWFPRGEHVYVQPESTPRPHLKEIRKSVAGMTGACGASVIFKNVYNSMRIAPIMEAIPEANFIVCKRDPVDVAQSILNARLRNCGSKEQWWSLPPKEVDAIKRKAYWEQIVEQVYYTYKQIESDRARVGADHFHEVDYHTLCESTSSAVKELESFFTKRNISYQALGNLVERFNFSTGKKVSDDDYQKIVDKVNKIWNSSNPEIGN